MRWYHNHTCRCEWVCGGVCLCLLSSPVVGEECEGRQGCALLVQGCEVRLGVEGGRDREGGRLTQVGAMEGEGVGGRHGAGTGGGIEGGAGVW